jgi:hypothetical protein
VVSVSTEQVTEQVKAFVQILSGEMDRQAIQNQLGLLHRENFRVAYLKAALQLGLIQMTIPDKPKSSNQKYKLSARGFELKKELES